MDSENDRPGTEDDPMELISLGRAAKRARVTRETLLRHARRGTLKTVKHGNRNLTTPAWTDEWLNDPNLHQPGNPNMRKRR